MSICVGRLLRLNASRNVPKGIVILFLHVVPSFLMPASLVANEDRENDILQHSVEIFYQLE